MKKSLLVILTWLLLFSGARAAELSQPHISVYGEAEEKVAPDRIVWYLNVTNKGTSLKEVASRHTEIVGSILDLLKASGISKENIQTSHMQFGENWNYRNSSRVKEGYFAATDIMFKLAKMDQYENLWMKFSGYDELSINTVTYEISDEKTHYQALRQKALLAAREKAERMAGALNAEIGEPLVIEEDTPSGVYQTAKPAVMAFNERTAQSAGQAAVAPGQITLQDRIKVIFRLIPAAQ